MHVVNVVETGTIADLNVCLNIEHTWPGDLVVTLTHDSTTVFLLNRVGVAENDQYGCEIDNVAVYLDDGAPDTIQDWCPPQPLIGVFSPAGSLADFNGQDRSGTWTLTVSDLSEGDTGYLTGFLMTFVTAAPTPTATATP